ncbi:MAG: hypothetical protein E7347_03375 [Clostridiales bacterium]|nr:hypothetical protein [Clostridiales bacterium]
MKGSKNTLNALSFFALMIIGLLLVIERLLPIVGINISGVMVGVLSTVKDVFVLIVIGLSAYNFTSGNTRLIKNLFWIAVAIYIVATVLLWI